jgi:hypothetical protein
MSKASSWEVSEGQGERDRREAYACVFCRVSSRVVAHKSGIAAYFKGARLVAATFRIQLINGIAAGMDEVDAAPGSTKLGVDLLGLGLGEDVDAIGVGIRELEGAGSLDEDVDESCDYADAGDADGPRPAEDVSRGGSGGGGEGGGLSFEVGGDGGGVVTAAEGVRCDGRKRKRRNVLGLRPEVDARTAVGFEGGIGGPGLHECPENAGDVLACADGACCGLGGENAVFEDCIVFLLRGCAVTVDEARGNIDASWGGDVEAEAGMDGLVDVK